MAAHVHVRVHAYLSKVRLAPTPSDPHEITVLDAPTTPEAMRICRSRMDWSMLKLGATEERTPVGNPRVLVVIPTLGDRLDTLSAALESVTAQRESMPLTLALVCPAGATEARKLGSAHGAILVSDTGSGISDAMNLGLAVRTTEEFYAGLGDDDLFRPGALRLLVDILDSRQDAVIAFGACEYISPGGNVVATSRAGRWGRILQPWGPNLIPHPGTVIRLDALQAVGSFASDLRFTMDLDVFLKLRQLGQFAHTSKVVSAFGWHPDSLTVSSRKASAREARYVKRVHLPKALRPCAVLWEVPLGVAARYAASGLNRRARNADALSKAVPLS